MNVEIGLKPSEADLMTAQAQAVIHLQFKIKIKAVLDACLIMNFRSLY